MPVKGVLATCCLAKKNAGCKITFKIADLNEVITYANDWGVAVMPSNSALSAHQGKIRLAVPAAVPNELANGDKGVIYASNDGGKTWTKTSSTITWGTAGSFNDLLDWNTNSAMNAVIVYTYSTSKGHRYVYLRGS